MCCIKCFLQWIGMVLSLFHSTFICAQELSAYNNLRRQFVIQDGYSEIVAEPLAAIDYKIGKSLVAYNDNSQQFKVYYKGEKFSPTKLLISEYVVSDNILTMAGGKVLRIFDQGQTMVLSARYGFYETKDSMVVYSDEINQKLLAYYAGKKMELESFLPGNDFKSYALGDNILGYNNFLNQFKIVYQGKVNIVENYVATNILAARDIVTYYDANQQFKVFYKGEVFVLDEFLPTKVWIADGMVAFLASDGNFKLFYDGKIKEIGYFNPATVGSQDYLLWYTDVNGYFKVFYNGEFYNPELSMPEDLKANYKSLVFVDRFKNLKMFNQGKIYSITSMNFNNLKLDYNVVQYTLGLNTVKIFGAEPLNKKKRKKTNCFKKNITFALQIY